jgi:RNA polymerase nonessential primary-like sigma factor
VKVESKDSVRLFLEAMGSVPLLSREEELKTTMAYRTYRQLELLKDKEVTPVNSTLIQYTRLLKLRELTSLQLSRKINVVEWAKVAGLDLETLRLLLLDGRTQWAILAGISVEEIIAIEKAGLAAKNLLMRSNLRLVVAIARKYINRGLEFSDLIQDGSIGLNRAIELFDPSRGYKLSTYAYPWIRQGITRAINLTAREIRLPGHMIEQITKIKKTKGALLLAGQVVTVEAIATRLDQTPEQIRFAIESDPRVLSLDKKTGKDHDLSLVDIIPSTTSTPDQVLDSNFIAEVIPQLLEKLDEREQKIIVLRYGLKGKRQTLVEIGQQLDLSRERIRQIERSAMKKLKAAAPQYQDVRQLLA